MEVTEHIKLIYQLSRIYQGGRFESMGSVYPKNPLTDYSKNCNIWAKRAYKKGYLDLVEDSSTHWTYKINNRGLELLKKFPDYYLHNPNCPDIFTTSKKPKAFSVSDELKKQRRRERRRLRKLRGGR